MPMEKVIISAKEEQDSSISPAIDGLLRVHKRIVDGLDGEVNQAPPSSRNMVPTRLLVAATQAGTLIGKQGATIKSIQEASNSAVRILDELPPVAMQDDRVVEIQGEPTAMHTAVELIAGHLRKFLVDRSVIPSFENHITIQHPPMDPYMPPAQPWGHPQRPPPNAGFDAYYAGNPRFTPQGPHDNFYPPPDLPPFEKPSHHGMSTYGQDAAHVGAHSSMNRQPPPLASQGPHHMQIPIAYADAVIGSAGANISYIRRTSGAAVIIQESRGTPGEMTVEISGSSTQVQTAQQLIQNFMAGAGAAAPGPAPGQSPMPPVDQGYGYAYGPPAHAGGGYDSSYGGNYGY